VIDIAKIFFTSLYPTMVEKRAPDLVGEVLEEKSRIFSSITSDSFSFKTIRVWYSMEFYTYC